MISVIIPVYNGSKTLKQCLSSVYNSDYKKFEVIVIDDGSRDDSVNIAKQFSCKILKLKNNKGIAIAENLGVKKSKGNILFFTDSDVLIKKNSLKIINDYFKNPEINAISGSYTKETPIKNFYSQYKNLLHHYTHQNSGKYINNLFGGCSAIRKKIFKSVNGFNDKDRILEDMNMAVKLIKRGYKINFAKNLQVTHMKRYTFLSLLKSDIFQRAVPWTKMMLKERVFKSDLNLKSNNILSVLTAYLILISLFFMSSLRYYTPILLIALFFLLNIHFYRFLYKEKGAVFTVKSIAFNWFSYLYQGIGLGLGVLSFLKDKLFNKS